jgi:hypothetical protein
MSSPREGCCGDCLRSCAATWPGRSPNGCLFLTSGVLSGNPMIYVGFTNRISTGDSFVRQHVIKRLRDPATVLTPDWTSPATV